MFKDRSRSETEINDTELRANAPAVFAEFPMPGASARYTFLPTARIVDAMREEGWKPVEAQQANVRLIERKGFQRHMVRFQRRELVAEVGEYAPEVVLLNSHDRSSGYQIRAGLYRFVCKNGLMVADGLIPAVYVRHSGQELTQIIEASFQILDQIPVLAERVVGFRNRLLSEAEASVFASKALQLRYHDPTLAPIRPQLLLDVRRNEDVGNSLWAITNRVQENLLRGGMCDTTRMNRAGKPFRAMRQIRGLQANVAINLGIWQLAESLRQN
jgi:hypothetical protein